ncbi:MAG TPA: hypothetical protein QGF58_03625 [Myxococcota bacterium]|nr:hypothetical protein [Myxococcota bacterium]
MKSSPWRLRLTHEGHSAIRVEWPGKPIRFDPYRDVGRDDRCVLTWHECERAEGLVHAIRAGVEPQVVASSAVRAWLTSVGRVRDQAPGGRFGEVLVEALEYAPIPYATPTEFVRKAKAGLMNPLLAVRRLRRRVGLPEAKPIIAQLTFPDGGRLLHLNCSLHHNTDAEWLSRAAQRFGGADWVILGVDYEDHDAIEQLIGRFEPGTLLVTDLVNDTRATLGLPTRILTPLVDTLKDRGFDAHPFVEGASYRYETQ